MANSTITTSSGTVQLVNKLEIGGLLDSQTIGIKAAKVSCRSRTMGDRLVYNPYGQPATPPFTGNTIYLSPGRDTQPADGNFTFDNVNVWKGTPVDVSALAESHVTIELTIDGSILKSNIVSADITIAAKTTFRVAVKTSGHATLLLQPGMLYSTNALGGFPTGGIPVPSLPITISAGQEIQIHCMTDTTLPLNYSTQNHSTLVVTGTGTPAGVAINAGSNYSIGYTVSAASVAKPSVQSTPYNVSLSELPDKERTSNGERIRKAVYKLINSFESCGITLTSALIKVGYKHGDTSTFVMKFIALSSSQATVFKGLDNMANTSVYKSYSCGKKSDTEHEVEVDFILE
jgi:hypothetical protein